MPSQELPRALAETRARQVGWQADPATSSLARGY